VLPKGEYYELDNTVLGQLLCSLNWDELKMVSGMSIAFIQQFLRRFTVVLLLLEY